MNVVGKVGSLISQGVYSVATPFHPFGGAVDVIVVEQQDGSYRSTPWYVRFGKFQGVLKGTEKIVRISVNGVEAGFHMYLDNSGEAYFVREVVPGKDNDKGAVKKSDSSEQEDDNNVDSSDINVSLCQNKSSVSIIDEVQISDECVSLSTEQIENDETDNERQLYEFQDQKSSRVDSVGSSDYEAYNYGSLDHVEDLVESQGSDSEVVLISVDGHVLTAPLSLSEENMENVQLSTPQFHLGPGDGADFRDNEEFSTGKDTWAADYLSDIDVSAPNGASESGVLIRGDSNASGNLSESHEVYGELVNRAQKTHNIDNMGSDTGEHNNSPDAVVNVNRKEIFKSCLELTELTLHAEDGESQDMGSPCMELEVKDSIANSYENSLSIIPAMEENEAGGDLKYEYSAGLSPHNFDSPCNNKLPILSSEIEISENNTLTVDNSDCLGSDSISLHSVNNDPKWKDEQFGLAQEPQGTQSSPGRSAPEQQCNENEIMEPQTRSSGVVIRPSAGMGFEISLCGNLLRAGMGLGLAGEAFDANRISEEEFKASASYITKNENLIVRFRGSYLQWEKAAPIILGMAAFGLDLPVERKDAIPVEQDNTPKPREDTPGVTSTSSGRKWRLWPIPFRRVKTLQHTNSNSSNEDIFVDSESGSQSPRAEQTPTSNIGCQSPHKQLVRTNIPTTEQIASLNLKDGQNMITFSFSTRVLGTQQVDAHIYLWKWNARIVISDVDGTITKSDVLGQFMPLVGKDWTQSGVARLFSAIKENGYQLLFLSARAIVQAYLTRSFLLNLKQDGKALPSGPVVISPDGLFPSLYREVIRRAPHEFKIACLEDIKALFPSDYNPFYAGFGNRDTDELSYRKIGIPKGKIFIINPKGEVAISHRLDVKSYTSLHTLVHDMFPPTSLVEQEDFNSWNFWKMPLPTIDL